MPSNLQSSVDLIKHSFGAQGTFNFKCGIGGCLHQFKTGTSFYSFKSHADRKHPHWCETLSGDQPQFLNFSSNEAVLTPLDNESPPEQATTITDVAPLQHITEKANPPSAKHTAALFLLSPVQ